MNFANSSARGLILRIILASCFFTFLTTASVAAQPPIDHIGDNLTPVFEKDATYIEECGTCHIPYPPMLLPEASWEKVMAGLENHFGDNTELDAQTSKYLQNYLVTHALEKERESVVGHWLKTLPIKPAIRITELQAFIDDHEDAYKRLGEGSEKPGFFSPCKDCHKEAIDGIFSKDRLFRGTRHLFKRFSGGN